MRQSILGGDKRKMPKKEKASTTIAPPQNMRRVRETIDPSTGQVLDRKIKAPRA